jgi:hypothetical protein
MMESRLSNQFLFVCLSLTLVVVTALSLAGQQTTQLGNVTEDDLKDLVISLERSTCYGDCPAYKLTIHGDGRVEYEGKKNVKLTTKKEGRLQPADVRKIVSAFDKANYFSIKSYTEESCSCTLCTDMPTAITEIRAKGLSHRVEHYYGCRCAPKELWELEESIDGIAGTKQWTGDVSKQGPFGTTCFNK